MASIEVCKERITKELQLAEFSRKQGNEGRARVCARRAAGFAIAWYYDRSKIPLVKRDALELMKLVQNETSFPGEVRAAAEHLTQRITPDFRYNASSDPLADAKFIIDFLMKENS